MNKKLHNKISDKFKTIGNKILRKISTKNYINTYGFYQPIEVKYSDKDLFVSTS